MTLTFDSEQRCLIEDVLDEERRRHPDIESHFDTDMIEPVFVKNIESVQGDERDVGALPATVTAISPASGSLAGGTVVVQQQSPLAVEEVGDSLLIG